MARIPFRMIGGSLFLAMVVSQAPAAVYINELYVDPPGSDDVTGKMEYVELRGEPNALLTGHYLVFIEGENSPSMGAIQNLFDLTGRSLGSNGLLSIRMNSSIYPSPNIDPNGNNLIQGGDYATPSYRGFGRGLSGFSTVGHQGEGDPERRDIENGVFTVLLINKGTGATPQVGDDLDTEEVPDGFGGTRYGDGALNLPAGWTVVDSIGVALEIGEADGTLYGMVNFGCENIVHRPVGAPFLDVNWGIGGVNDTSDDEIEYIARWGKSTGSTLDDWVVANLTNAPKRSGYTYTVGNLMLSAAGDNHEGPVQCSKDLPYGTILTNTIGGTNIARYGLALTVNNPNYGSVLITPEPSDPNDPRYFIGTPVTLTATPIEGKSFREWTIWDPNFPGDANHVVTDSNVTTTVVMWSDMQVDAAFKCGTGLESVFPLMTLVAAVGHFFSHRGDGRR